MNGWIKDWRKTLEWGWFTDVPTAHFWEYVRLRANRGDSVWLGEVIRKGSFAASINHMSFETGLTPKQIRLAISKLEKTGEITVSRTNKYTIISVVKWADYQGSDDEEGKQEDMPEGKPTLPERTLNGEEKKIRSKNKPPFIPPRVEEVREYCESRSNGIVAEEFVDFYTSKNWMIGKSKMADWKAAVRTWERKRKGPEDTTVPVYDDTNNVSLTNNELDNILKEMNRGIH